MTLKIFWLTFACFLLVLMGGSLLLYEAFSESNQPILYIAQNVPSGEALLTDELAEWLGLSADCSTHIRRMDLRKMKKRLLELPMIRGAKITRFSPTTLLVEYSLRSPQVWVKDGDNVAMDRSGFLFPFFPFYPFQKMSAFYLGLSQQELRWNQPLTLPLVELGWEILEILTQQRLFVLSVDLSKSNMTSLGRREIVVTIERGQGHHYLRLTPDDIRQQLSRYVALSAAHSLEESWLIDLRIPQMAFIKPLN